MNNEFILTKENVAMLKHLNSTINNSIVFRENTDIVQMRDPESRKVARVAFGIPSKTFGVRLNALISVITMLETDRIYLEDESIRISSKNGTVFLEYADHDLIKCCPTKNYDLGEVVAEFTLSNEMLSQLRSFGKIIESDEVKFYVEDGTLYAETYNFENTTSSTYKLEICTAENMDETTEFRMSLNYLNLLPGVYTVKYYETKFTSFESAEIQYYIATRVDGDR